MCWMCVSHPRQGVTGMDGHPGPKGNIVSDICMDSIKPDPLTTTYNKSKNEPVLSF